MEYIRNGLIGTEQISASRGIYFLSIHPKNGFLRGSEFDKTEASRHTYWKEDPTTLTSALG